ncbi:LuxR C-terminal-related transcriptional regulator [Desulfobacterales bacterium HSG17]|nr:LuxR C-terminal-related transcriptional regulator [Desulfobacterales bacterium HSG17]
MTIFDKIVSKKITTVTAAAGYGKTTIISQAIKYLKIKAVWYQLDEYDNDLNTFLSYLIKSFGKYWIDIETKLMPLLEQNPSSQREIRSLLSNFLIEIENLIDEDILLVLDDYQFILDNIIISNAILYLLERIPPNIHFILISRKNPEQSGNLNISLFQSRQQHLEINETDIAFSIKETEAVLKNLFQIKLSQVDLKQIHKKSGGWITGLILSHTFNKSTGTNKTILSNKSMTKNIFQYFETNVTARLPKHITEFLLKSSYFSELETELCDYLLEIDNSNEILSFLFDQHIFTTPFFGEKHFYRYHHLFQEFLHYKFNKKMSAKQHKQFHIKIAAKLERINNTEEALRHYFKAKQFNEIVRILKVTGYKLLLQGHFKNINTYINNLPIEISANNPDIIFLRAKIISQQGETLKSIAEYYKAKKLFKQNNNKSGELNCLNELGSHYAISGDFPKAKRILNSLIPKFKNQPMKNIVIFGRLSLISSYLGDFVFSDKHLNNGFRHVATLNNNDKPFAIANLYMTQSLRYLWSGNFNKALNSAFEVKKICIETNQNLLAFAYHLIARAHFHKGDYQTGYETAQLGLIEANRLGLKDVLHVWPLLGSANNLLELNKIIKSIETGEKALRLFQGLDYVFGEARAFQHLSYAHFKNHNSKNALHCLRSALGLIEKVTMPLFEGELKADLAALLIKDSHFQEAEKLLNQAQKLLIPSKYEIARVFRIYAFFEWSRKNIPRSRTYFKKALKICIQMKYNAWIDKESPWIMPLIADFQNDRNFDTSQRNFLNNIIVSKEELKNKISNISKTQKDANNSLPSPLTNREIEVLQMVARGLTNMEISDSLKISPHTVKSHVVHIFNKLGVNDRIQASVWSVQNNLY